MPANLTLQYLQAEERYKAATNDEEREAALELMIAQLPKHKHTEKMYADLKSRLSKLRKGEGKKSAPARHESEYVIRREGAGQFVLIGPPNTGKSAIMAALTKADVVVTDYPFATRKPAPGMMRYEDVPIQLVDTPSLSPDVEDPFVMPLIKQADAAVIVVDLSSPNFLDQPAQTLGLLRDAGVMVVPGTVTSVPRSGFPRPMPGFVVCTHADREDPEVALELLREVLPDPLFLLALDVANQTSLGAFCRRCFDLLGVIRVYAKAPGREADRDRPFLLPAGSGVLDFAEQVHRDFRERFSYARLWRTGVDGQRASRDEPLQDGDVVELHTL